jgi:competence protein CoiA
MMQYALIDGKRSEPFKGAKGVCDLCKCDVLAKCGDIKVHHWAHVRKENCDNWWEEETLWHRNWKNIFPEEFREFLLSDDLTGEKHRADIHTDSGVTIEFQHSSLSVQEFEARCNFYKKLIWVVDGSTFANSFQIEGSMLNPNDLLLKDFEFREGMFSRKGHLYPYFQRAHDVTKERLSAPFENHEFYFSFRWQHARICWFCESAAIFFDFGDSWLYRIKHRIQPFDIFWYLHRINKDDFLNKYATRDKTFYKIYS